MKIGDWLADHTKQLSDADLGSARLDCLILLEDELEMPRASILAHTDQQLSPEQLLRLNHKIAQRIQHMPLAYIRGFVEFYGRRFFVTKNVLVPRPETEIMIELLKKISPTNTIIDLGTGSGALAITAKHEFPAASVYGVDIDPRCLTVARRNSSTHKIKVHFQQSDLLDGCADDITHGATILANLPYVPVHHPLNLDAAHEPHHAIFSGQDGLDHYRKLFTQAQSKQVAIILTEGLPFQHTELQKIGMDPQFSLALSEGYIQVFTASEPPQA